MNLENLSRQELISVFKESLEEQDEQSKKMAAHLHGEIFPTLMFLNTNIQIHNNDLNNGKAIFKGLEKDKEIINLIAIELRKITTALYPSLLKNFGLTKAMEGIARTSSEERSTVIDFRNSTPETKAHLSDAKALHIIILFTNILNLLLAQPQAPITIQVRISDIILHLNFVKTEEKKKLNKEYLKKYSLNSKLKTIQARLLVLNAKVAENSDWCTKIEIDIPL